MIRRTTGFTLIEMTIFIVVIAIVMASVFLPLQTILIKSPQDARTAEAYALAQSRMAVIEGEYGRVGFDGMLTGTFTCSSLDVCSDLTTPSGYTVTSTIADNWQGSSRYKVASVDVSGLSNAQLTYVMAEY